MLGKPMVEGRDAESCPPRGCTNDLPLPAGRVAYTLTLNEYIGIESDVALARHADNAFMAMNSLSHFQRGGSYLRGNFRV